MQEDASLRIARCTKCETYTLPVNAYGCRSCGADRSLLEEVDLPDRPKLVNFVTLYAPLSPELNVPCVIGEVEFAPGVIEEAVIDVCDETDLQIGIGLTPRLTRTKTDKALWVFTPESHQEGCVA